MSPGSKCFNLICFIQLWLKENVKIKKKLIWIFLYIYRIHIPYTVFFYTYTLIKYIKETSKYFELVS